MEYLSKNPWRYMRLSSNLKDLISEKYPLISSNCEVTLQSSSELCEDPLDICNHLNIMVSLKWPLSVVVAEEEIKVYNSIFHFLIKLKWALHTLNGLALKGDNFYESGGFIDIIRELFSQILVK